VVGNSRGEGRREHHGIREDVTPTEAIDTVPTDPDDNRVLECAVSAGSQTIVTGDDDLLRLVAFRGIEIVRIADFLTRFSAGDR
jgi:predicted nucleic acid-binding protein